MHFDSCIKRLQQKGLLKSAFNPVCATFDRLVIDSREVGPSDCFVAIEGSNFDGHMFIDKAVKNGASAIVCDAGPPATAGPAYAHVSDSHIALAELSSLLNGDPATGLSLIATTGTNGKTTVATLICDALEASGKKTGFIGTTGYRVGESIFEASHTTPSAVRLYELFGAMQRAGCSACSMEASSHAIDQVRFRVEDVNVALFTNLTRDHLDYHTTFDAYFLAKKRLFDGLSSDAAAVTNLDDARGKNITSDCSASVITFGVTAEADVRYGIVENELSGLVLDLDGRRSRFRLAGKFNAQNLAAAYAACLALGFAPGDAIDLLSDCPPVEGRMDWIRTEDGSIIVVDFAHTPDALENVLSTIRESLSAGTDLYCVFGCGGDRDRGKRREMGAIAEKLADHTLVTSDNPRTEDPASILDDIREGFRHGDDASWIVDRKQAIYTAVGRMKAGDTLLLAGKGHETYQVVGSKKIEFDDRKIALQAFEERNRSEKRG